ncbi:MAG: tRNA epoxyqueuosine(34) reductase QueG, partial [Acidobacteria bacterium]|nr:tRNA epoxyqueuosine(34) reductase QueG [Acidobacteriota bacterium]
MARECGFELAGIAAAGPVPESAHYHAWVARNMAGGMRFLTGHRAALRDDARLLLPSARSVISVGKLYNTGPSPDGVSRHARGRDYHAVVRAGLEKLAARLREESGPFEYKACVDTAPLLERALARRAGLGWLGKNTCLINQPLGSWFVLGELITSLDLAPGEPPPDRCGTCTRCIEACPTQALVQMDGRWVVDARRCIAYLTIEHRSPIPEELQPFLAAGAYGCDLCQEVCPWNRRAPVTEDPAFAPLDAPVRRRG